MCISLPSFKVSLYVCPVTTQKQTIRVTSLISDWKGARITIISQFCSNQCLKFTIQCKKLYLSVSNFNNVAAQTFKNVCKKDKPYTFIQPPCLCSCRAIYEVILVLTNLKRPKRTQRLQDNSLLRRISFFIWWKTLVEEVEKFENKENMFNFTIQ